MNYKSILLKGLPVLVVAVVIIVVAAIASRPKAQPTITNPDEIVFEYGNLKVTKEELYSMLKLNVGSTVLLDMIDRELLADYYDDIDEKELEDKINAMKKQGIDAFYRNMVRQGVITSPDEDEETRDQKIRDFYILSLLQKAYAKDVARQEIYDEEEKTHAIQKAKDEYKEDMCVIVLRYSKEAKANQISEELRKRVQDPEKYGSVLDFFKQEYADQHKDDEDTDTTEREYPPFIDTTVEYECEYDYLVYSELSNKTAFRDFVFADEYLGEPFTVEGDEERYHFNQTGKFIPDDATYFVYKLSKPKYKENYRQSPEFEKYFVDQLVDKRATDTYTSTKVRELRKDSEIKIYDTIVANYIKSSISNDFKGESKLLKDKSVLATFKVGDETKTITADDLYNKMKTQYTLEFMLDLINYEVLIKKAPEIQLTKAEKQEYIDLIKAYKTGYSQNPPAGLTWIEYLRLYHGIFYEEQLVNVEAVQTLITRYILGYENWEGTDKIDDDDILEAYEKWFNIDAYVIFLEYNPEDDESQEIASKKAYQIINGCQEDEECYIFYDVNPDDNDDEEEEDKEVPFVGFADVDYDRWKTVFQALAREYSDDPNAKTNGGFMSKISYGQQNEKFEKKLLEIRDNYNKSGKSLDRMGIVEENRIKQSDGTYKYGYQVIYMTYDAPKTARPDNIEKYKEYLQDLENDDVDIQEKYSADEISKFNAYRTFENTLKTNLENKYTTALYKEMRLAQLRNELGINFKDAEINAVYQNYTKLLSEYNPDARD